VTSLDILSKYLVIMELRFDVMLCSNLGSENFYASHIKCSCEVHVAHGPWVTHPWCRARVHNLLAIASTH